MNKPIAIYYKILEYQPENLKRLHENFDVFVLPNPAHDTQEMLSQVNVLFAPLGYMVDKEKIDNCPCLKVIASNTTGHPHIDIEYAKQKNIDVACLKFAKEFLQTITPTAELSFGLMIALTRNIVSAHNKALKGVWNRRLFGAHAMLSSMGLGIVGLGRLGTMMAEYALAFSMTVRYYDPFVDNHPENVLRCETLEELVALSDVVSIHVPHEPETEGMFNAEIFNRFKYGAYLINTARGELIDWGALLEYLENGHIAGAGLDVFEGEFVPGFSDTFPEHPVLNYAKNNGNLILTQHIGGSTHDAWIKTEGHTIDMTIEFLNARES